VKVALRSAWLVALGLALASAGVACQKTATERPAAADAGDDAATLTAASEPVDAGRGAPVVIGASHFQAWVLDRPEPADVDGGAKRLGYLRNGATAEAYPTTLENEHCKDGWYELVRGGFVCGKYVTTDLNLPRFRLAPKQPDKDAGLPYKYGKNLYDGTPLYRRALRVDDRKKYEPWLEPPKQEDDAGAQAEAHEETPPEETKEPPKPTLKELKGRGPLVRKMMPGFFLALDKPFRSSGARWWRTTYAFATPFERIAVQKKFTAHHGAWFSAIPTEGADGGVVAALTDGGGGHVLADADADAAAPSLVGAVAFVTVGYAASVTLDDERKKAKAIGPTPKRTALLLTGERAKVSGVEYVQTSDGSWARLMDLTLASPAPPPAELTPGEKWIDVDLTRQTLVAFEGARPVFATLVSSGKRNPQDKERDFPTPTGTFRIREKHVTVTMDGDVASDGPYSIEDVPWVMYFHAGYGFHAAFWHDSFGRPRSHGCVNLAPDDARTLFAWSSPALPDGWHGVMAKDAADGTLVVVHEDAPQKKR
jgi:lipoprotein-anchoring transpeptidase ErfK/SrfK